MYLLIKDLLKALVFIFLAVLGIPGNSFILLKFAYVRIAERKLLPTNIILMFLAFMNLLVVLYRVILQILYAFGVKNVLDHDGCKFVFFNYRVGRAMSICVTCLLSCYQCILIAPNTKLWINLKLKMTKQFLVFTIMVLIFINGCLYSSVLLYEAANGNFTTSPYSIHVIYCHADFLTYISYVGYGTIYTLRDFLFVGLMTIASSHMVYVLLKHEKTLKNLKKSERQTKSAEYKASRSIIMLVALYVFLFGLENIIWVYTLTIPSPDISINDVRIVLACSYATISPVIIIKTNPKLSLCIKNSNTESHIRIQKNYNITCLSR